MDNYKENGYGSNNDSNEVKNTAPMENEAAGEVSVGDGAETMAQTASENTENTSGNPEAKDEAASAESTHDESEEASTANDIHHGGAPADNPNLTYHYTGGAERPFAPQTPPPRYSTPGAGYQGAQYNAPGRGYAPGQNYTAGGYAGGAGRVYPPHIPTDPPKKEKKGFGAGAIAVLCACGILVSVGSGFLGAMAANSLNKSNNPSGGGSMLVYKNPETGTLDDNDTSAPSTSLEHVAAAVSDSVVEITTEFKVQSSMFQYVSEGAGSGVIISPDGYIITNNHVITYSSSSSGMGGGSTGQVADTITIRLRNGDKYTAKLIGRDADADIAVLKVDATGLTSAVIGNSDNLNVGTDVVAVGNPLGELGGTVTNGIISALDREIDVDGVKMNLLQTNAAVNPGNSGGGLFNMKGELIGVVNAKSSGTGVEGLGFAIPVNDAMDIVEQLMDYGYVRGKIYIGVSFYNAADAYSAYHYFKSQSPGIYVAGTEKGYNDESLKYGDRIIAIDGTEVTSMDSIKSILKSHSVGDTLTFTVYRENKLTEVTVTCYESKPAEGNVSFETN